MPPDGDRVAFAEVRDGRNQVATVAATDGERHGSRKHAERREMGRPGRHLHACNTLVVLSP